MSSIALLAAGVAALTNRWRSPISASAGEDVGLPAGDVGSVVPTREVGAAVEGAGDPVGVVVRPTPRGDGVGAVEHAEQHSTSTVPAAAFRQSMARLLAGGTRGVGHRFRRGEVSLVVVCGWPPTAVDAVGAVAGAEMSVAKSRQESNTPLEAWQPVRQRASED
jgi:hypothetical protein